MADGDNVVSKFSKIMRHPVRFVDGGKERCLTLFEAEALIVKIQGAVKKAHAEISEE